MKFGEILKKIRGSLAANLILAVLIIFGYAYIYTKVIDNM